MYSVFEINAMNTDDLRNAAQAGCAEAQHRLGRLYLSGLHNVPQDEREAFYWFVEAADQGHLDALEDIRNIFRDYYFENFKPSWIDKLAGSSDPDAWEILGEYYFQFRFDEGFFTKKRTINLENCIEAKKWLRKAADCGNPRAQNNLSILLSECLNSEKNSELAEELLQISANQNYTPAQHRLDLEIEKKKELLRQSL